MNEGGIRQRKRGRVRHETPAHVRARLLQEKQEAETSAEDFQHSGAFTESAMQAWFATALESTKSIFTLASAGVGLSVTLAFGSDSSKTLISWAPVWFVFATFCFGVSSVFFIYVFRANAKYLVPLLNPAQDEPTKGAHKTASARGLLRRFDLGSKIAFGGGLVFLFFALVAKTWLQA